MARKNKNLTTFDDVANNNNINNNNNSDNNILTDVLKSKKTKDQTHVFKGFYLEHEVAHAIDRITEGKQKGVKSELVNEILKKYFREEGIL